VAHAVARQLGELARKSGVGRGGLLIEEINGQPAQAHPQARELAEMGFSPSPLGIQIRPALPAPPPGVH
jgi:hypothetical protein